MFSLRKRDGCSTKNRYRHGRVASFDYTQLSERAASEVLR
jgi:hypothetical protein